LKGHVLYFSGFILLLFFFFLYSRGTPDFTPFPQSGSFRFFQGLGAQAGRGNHPKRGRPWLARDGRGRAAALAGGGAAMKFQVFPKGPMC